MQPVPRILVGVDGSPDADGALRWAITLARALAAEVLAVHAVTLLAHLGPGPAVPSEAHTDEIRQRFEETWCGPLVDSGVAFRRLLVPGEAVTTLLRLAEEREVDLIVVGRRGTGGFPQLRLGSTSHQLAEHAPCPVLVVPVG